MPSILTGWYAPPNDLQSTQDSPCEDRSTEAKGATQSPVPEADLKKMKFNLGPTQQSTPTLDKQLPSQYGQDDHEQVRFSMLPGDRRPEPVAPITEDDDVEDEFDSVHVFIVPEPLSAPQVGNLNDGAYRVRGQRRDARPDGSFLRENVPVTLVLKNGKLLDMNAATYIWDEPPLRNKRKDWGIDSFVKSTTFRKLSGGGDENDLRASWRLPR